MALTGSVPFRLYRKIAYNHGPRVINAAAGNIILTNMDEDFLSIDPNGGAINVTLPAVAGSYGQTFCIFNASDAAEAITVKSPAAVTIATLAQGESCMVGCTDTAWTLCLAMPASAGLTGSANDWALLQSFSEGILIKDAKAVKFGTPGTDLVLTADGTDVVVSSTGDLVFNDSVDIKIGTGKDIGLAWDGTRMNVTQAAPNSEIRWGVDGAGIDQRLYGDTAGTDLLWDQSADTLVMGGVAKVQFQTIVAADAAAIPVTHSGSFPITQAGAETNSLADPTYLGQWLSIFVDTDTAGARVITAASRINQAANTIITLTEVGDFIKLEAITIAGALKWQVVANDGAVLS
jgi:hypothetical protein